MDLIEQFGAEFYPLNGTSPQRQRNQTSCLRRFERWLAPRAILDAEPEDVRRWMTISREAGLEPNTIRWHLMMLRPFWRWAHEAGHLEAMHWYRLRDVSPPRGSGGQSLPRPYTRAEIKQLWREIDAKYRQISPRSFSQWQRRNSLKRPPTWSHVAPHGRRLQIEAIVSLALYCGLRSAEIFEMSLEDLHPDNAYLAVRGKADPTTGKPKHRKVPYTDPAREAVAKWLEFRRSLFIKRHRSPWLCLRAERYREPIYLTQYNGLLRRIGKGYELHRLRHTCATERLRAGMPIAVLKEFLGHAQIAQTLMYAQVLAADVAKHTEAIDEEFMKAVGRAA